MYEVSIIMGGRLTGGAKRGRGQVCLAALSERAVVDGILVTPDGGSERGATLEPLLLTQLRLAPPDDEEGKANAEEERRYTNAHPDVPEILLGERAYLLFKTKRSRSNF